MINIALHEKIRKHAGYVHEGWLTTCANYGDLRIYASSRTKGARKADVLVILRWTRDVCNEEECQL